MSSNSDSYVKTVITVTVLSEGDFEFENLDDMTASITYGDCSGNYEVTSVEYLTREQMAEALKAQGSDPEFLIPDYEDPDEP